MQTYLIIALVSYLLGSIPFGYILVRLFLKQDIRATGSGNIGATNVGRTGHKGLAIATLLLDAAKGYLAVMVATEIYIERGGSIGYVAVEPQMMAPAIAALFAITGHLFPIWLRFRGGKGVATGAGAFLALAPFAVGAVLVAFLLIVAVTRYVSLGSIVATLLFPFAYHAFVYPRYLRVTLVIGLCSLLVVGKHHANIRRLLAGTEPKFGAKPTIPPPQEMEKNA